jgi:hypothetical protein
MSLRSVSLSFADERLGVACRPQQERVKMRPWRVLEARARRRRTAYRPRSAPEAINPVLVEEFRRS